MQYSVPNQMISVFKATSLVLPSFLSPLMPFLLLMGSFFVNYKLNSNNEIIILKQYLNIKQTNILFFFLAFGLFFFYIINSEYFSVKMYHKYKVEELEIRNNLKLGVPSQNEFHIDNQVSIFFENEKNDIFYDIEALIYKEGQFIKSDKAEIEISKKNFNLVFYNGERLLLNFDEKSKTNFDKFTYSLVNKSVDELMMDKEHYNTFDLINNNEIEFNSHGHNKIYQYIVLVATFLISFKIIFLYEPKKKLLKKFGIIFLVLLLIQIVNSFSIYQINNNNLQIIYYYLINILGLCIFTLVINRYIK